MKIGGIDPSTLSSEEIAEIKLQERPEDYVIEGFVNLNAGLVKLKRGDSLMESFRPLKLSIRELTPVFVANGM